MEAHTASQPIHYRTQARGALGTRACASHRAGPSQQCVSCMHAMDDEDGSLSIHTEYYRAQAMLHRPHACWFGRKGGEGRLANKRVVAAHGGWATHKLQPRGKKQAAAWGGRGAQVPCCCRAVTPAAYCPAPPSPPPAAFPSNRHHNRHHQHYRQHHHHHHEHQGHFTIVKAAAGQPVAALHARRPMRMACTIPAIEACGIT